jgi:uncharacterized protein YjbI with pentapeptide repeats
VLARVDEKRKERVVLFLHGAGLIDSDEAIIGLDYGDRSSANLTGTNLFDAKLEGAKLEGAKLEGANRNFAG